MIVLVFPCTSLSSRLPSIVPSAASAYFWLVVVWNVFDRQPSEAMVYFILFIFLSLRSPPQTMGWCPPTWSPPHPLRYDITPIASADSRLIVGYLDQSAAYLMPRPASLSII